MKMMQTFFILLILVLRAFSDSCVTYNFEVDYDDLFTNDPRICARSIPWVVGCYEDIGITGHNELSSKFIYPSSQSINSCATSFTFPMTVGGVIEVNIFMEIADRDDYLDVYAIKSDPGSNSYITIAAAGRGPGLTDLFMPNWHTLTMRIDSSQGNFTGLIAIMGMANPMSTVLVDSFRYIPAEMDEGECLIYYPETTSTSTTPIETTTIAPEVTTELTTISTTGIVEETTTITTTEIVEEPTMILTTEIVEEPTTISTTKIVEEPTTISPTEIIEETTTITTTETVEEPTTISTTEIVEELTTQETTDNIQTTELPTTLPTPDDDDSFWTPKRIKIIAAVSAILILILLSICCWCCCRSNNKVAVVVVRA